MSQIISLLQLAVKKVSCSLHKLKHSNRAKDWCLPNKTFKVSNGAGSLVMKDISLHSNEPHCIHLKAGSASNQCAVYLSTVPHGGKIKSLWDCNCGRQGSELGVKPSTTCWTASYHYTTGALFADVSDTTAASHSVPYKFTRDTILSITLWNISKTTSGTGMVPKMQLLHEL